MLYITERFNSRFLNRNIGKFQSGIIKNIVFTLIAFILIPGSLFAQDEKTNEVEVVEKEKIVIYYFRDNSKINLYRYYSYIISNSIESEIVRIDKAKRYEIKTFPIALDYLTSSAPEDVLNNHIRLLSDRGKEFSASYIVTGAYAVEKSRIAIKTQIFDVNNQQLSDIEESSNKLGAILNEVIENITHKINSELDRSYQKKREKERAKLEEEKERLAISPFNSLYNGLSGITFGVSLGMMDIHDEWGDIYENNDFISIYLFYDLANTSRFKQNILFKNIAISSNFDFFLTETRNPYQNERSSLSVWGITLGLNYLFRFSDFINLAFRAGMGGSLSKIHREGRGDYSSADTYFQTPGDRETIDPYLDLSIYSNINISAIHIMAGAAYKRIMFTDKYMGFLVYSLGLGYRI